MSLEVDLPPPDAGFVERTLTRWFMRPAHITRVEPLSDHFRFIEFEGEALKEGAWQPGHKIQIKIGRPLATRTYTPIEWDPALGTMRILAYAHTRDAPGGAWVLAAQSGASQQIFGPRRSLDLTGLPARTVLFGDETSFGVAMALRAQLGADAGLRYVFEVTDREEAEVVLKSIALGGVQVIARERDGAHLTDVLSEDVDDAVHWVLTGQSTSVQRLSRALKARGVERRRLRAKVYWAPGKTGLD